MTDATNETVGEWIDRQQPPVPEEFQRYLSDDLDRPASLEALMEAATTKITAATRAEPHDRAAAFTLLAGDAYLTYACIWVLEDNAEPTEARLHAVTARIVADCA